MNTIKSILTIVVFSTILFGCKETGSQAKTNTETATKIEKTPIAADAKLASASFNIDGMTCAIGCAKTIEKELNDTQGVKTATVDFDKKTAVIEYDVAQQSPEKLIQIVEKTGDGNTYKVSNL